MSYNKQIKALTAQEMKALFDEVNNYPSAKKSYKQVMYKVLLEEKIAEKNNINTDDFLFEPMSNNYPEIANQANLISTNVEFK